MKQLALGAIRFYQKHLSGKAGVINRHFPLFYSSCRFTPSCSEYTYQAISEYGILRGMHLGIKRLLRCQPFSVGGHDPLK